MLPKTKYARSDDVRIAYQVTGDGPFDLARARPLPDLLKTQPPYTLETSFGIPDADIAIYLADERELKSARGLANDNVERGAGQPIQGSLSLLLPYAPFRVSCFDPKTNARSPVLTLHGSADTKIDLPSFTHDIVVRIQRASGSTQESHCRESRDVDQYT